MKSRPKILRAVTIVAVGMAVWCPVIPATAPAAGESRVTSTGGALSAKAHTTTL